MKAGLARWIFWGLALFLFQQALHHFSLVLHHPYPIEYGEGVNLLWSQRAMEGQPIYPVISKDSLPQLHNPYPPLFPLFTSLLQSLGFNSHPFAAGRYLSLFGLLLSALALYALIRRRSRDVSTGVLFVLLFLLSPMILRFGTMMRVDSLALGFSLQALNQLDRRKLSAAALLAALALCVKPSFAATALCVAVMALQSKDLKKITRTALCGTLPVGILLLWMSLQPASNWQMHLFTLQGLPPDFNSLFIWLAHFTGQHAPLLTLGILAYSKADTLLKIYAPALLLPLLLTAWISGSQENYLMELWAAACLLSSLAWPEIRESHPRAAWLLLLLQLGLLLPTAPAPVFTRTYGQEIPDGNRSLLSPTESDLEIGKLIEAELVSVPGPVLSADLGYLIPAGHAPMYQPYQFEHLTAAGKWSGQALQAAIESSTFSMVLIKGEVETAGDPTFNPETQHLIDQYYVLHRVLGPWHLYRRK